MGLGYNSSTKFPCRMPKIKIGLKLNLIFLGYYQI